MADGSLRDPFLAQHKQQRQRGRTEASAERVLAASSAVRGHSYARQRAIERRQRSTIHDRERDHSTVASILSPLASPFVQFHKRFIHELNFLSLPAKAGLAAAICSILCFVPGPLSNNGSWAVITTDVCLGANVGLTLYKGLNRTLGTLAAAALALLVDYLAPMCGKYEPFFVIFWTFLGAAIPTMFKFRRPFRDRWDYAAVMSMITFHILILSKSDYDDKIKLPTIRLVTIVIGFCTASLVNLCVAPIYAGDMISELVANNFERAGNVMERCVIAYCDGTVLEQVHDIRAGKSEDDNIHTSFHDIVSSDAVVEKLLKAVPYEPCHGKFFFGYPWHMYEDITDVLRYTLYDVVALDSCLRAEIQAPPHLRNMFEEEFLSIGKECAQVFRMIGESIRLMRHVHCLHQIQQAEEGALLLQHKIAKYIGSQLGCVSADSVFGKSTEARKEEDAYEEHIRMSFGDAYDDHTFATPEGWFGTEMPPVERSDNNGSTDGVKFKRPHLEDDHHPFLRRRESMDRQWNNTVMTISILSLIKFASILIELVAKAKYVASIVDELEIKGRFATDEGNFATNNPKPRN